MKPFGSFQKSGALVVRLSYEDTHKQDPKFVEMTI